MDRDTDRIVPLDDLPDFDIAEGDPDVRGWHVLSADGQKVGEVDNLLVDSSAMKVRYLDVDLDDDVIASGDTHHHILVPIGYARLDEDDDQIFVDALSREKLRQIPAYRSEPLTPAYESELRTRYDSDYSVAAEPGSAIAPEPFEAGGIETEGEQRITRSEEELAVGRRERQVGEVELEKHVEHEHRHEEIPTHHEEVIVERRPADPAIRADARIDEDEEIRIPVNEEELVVDKRIVPKEEIVVRKQDRIEEEDVDADLRRERVDIRREGDVDVRDNR